jgi:hypothetical protein
VIPGIVASKLAGGPIIDPANDLIMSLAHFEGSNGSTTFADQYAGRTWTRTGTGIVLDTSQKPFGGSSLKFTGVAGDYIQSDFHVELGCDIVDFTVEGWWRFASLAAANKILMDFRETGTTTKPCVYVASDNSLRYYWNGSDRIISAASVVTTNTWYHIAVCRVAGVTRLFLNGTQVGSNFTDANTYERFCRVTLGSDGGSPTGTGKVTGWMKDFRFSNGKGWYNANFSPTAAPFFDPVVGAYAEMYWNIASGNVGPGLSYNESATQPHLVVRPAGGNDAFDNGMLATRFRNSGKRYLECRQWRDGGNWSSWTGIVPSGTNLINITGEPTVGCFLFMSRGGGNMLLTRDNVGVGLGTAQPSDTVCGIAVDFALGRLYLRANTQGWISSTNTFLGAFDASNPTYTFTPGASMAVYGSSPFANSWFFINPGPAFRFAPPPGFTYW